MDARDLHTTAIVIDGSDPSGPTRGRFLRMRDAGVTAAVDAFPNVTIGLLGRRFDEPDARKILGENFLRVSQETWDGRD